MLLSQDFKEFLQSLNDNGVKYLIIGGYAVAFHGHPRYTKDIDIADTFQTAYRSLVWKIGDCDDFVITLGALLISAGYKVKMVVVHVTPADTWSHIYLLAGIPPGGEPKKWIAMDASEAQKPGWEVPKNRVVKRMEVPVNPDTVSRLLGRKVKLGKISKEV